MVTIRPSRIDPAVGEVACQQFPPMRTRSSGEEVPTPADRSTVAANQPTSILVWLTLSVNTPAGDQRLMINKQRDAISKARAGSARCSDAPPST
jgi:hypothetical protein